MLRAKTIVASGDWSGQPADSVVLEFEQRYRRHAELTTVGGLEVEVDLDQPAMLRGGDGLRLEDGRIVEVLAAPESLIEIRAEPLTLIRIALSLGNAHALVEATAKALRIRRDPDIEATALALGARLTPLTAPFNPEGVDYATGAAHAHDHDHEHHDHAHHGHDHHGHDHHEHEHHRGDSEQHERAQDHAHGHPAHEPDQAPQPGHHDHDHNHDHDLAVRRHHGEESDH